MPSTSTAIRCLVLVIALPTPNRVAAQPPTNADVLREVASIRMGRAGNAGDILTQRHKTYDRVALDALADSLVAISLGARGTSAVAEAQRTAVRQHLLLAGCSEKRPYVGAGQRLFRIAQESSSAGDRGAAIGALGDMPNIAESLLLLRRLATSRNPSAYKAVATLDGCLGEKGGRKVLRELLNRGHDVARAASQRRHPTTSTHLGHADVQCMLAVAYAPHCGSLRVSWDGADLAIGQPQRQH